MQMEDHQLGESVSSQIFLRFGPYFLESRMGELRKRGIGIKLSGQPLEVLVLLLERPGDLVTREELRQRLWTNDVFVDFERSLNSAVKKLRRALNDDPQEPRYIETYPRKGYRFIGVIEHEPAPTVRPASSNTPGTQHLDAHFPPSAALPIERPYPEDGAAAVPAPSRWKLRTAISLIVLIAAII